MLLAITPNGQTQPLRQGIDAGNTGRILVYDLCGGTLDTTILEVEGDNIKILTSEGARHLGGSNFDDILLEAYAEQYKKQTGAELFSDERHRRRVLQATEDAKKMLSKLQRVNDTVANDQNSGIARIDLSREHFEKMIRNMLTRTVFLVEQALDSAKLKTSDIDHVVLVGGSTRIPKVKTILEKMFGKTPKSCGNVDECVALGAALFAKKSAKIQEVCNASYGTLAMVYNAKTNEEKLMNSIVIPNSIRVNKKDNDGNTLRGLTIYDHSDNLGNTKVLMADSGKMLFTPDGKAMIVTLHHGSSYEEINNNRSGKYTHPLMRTTFEYEELRFDLSSFAMKRTDKDLFKENKSMLNVYELNHAIVTFEADIRIRQIDYHRSMMMYLAMTKDSINFNKEYARALPQNPYQNITQLQLEQVRTSALNQANSLRDIFVNLSAEYKMKEENIARYRIEWHRKFTLSIACFILFIIGAPLGAIIRKGGLGVPIIIAIICFLLFHVTSITR